MKKICVFCVCSCLFFFLYNLNEHDFYYVSSLNSSELGTSFGLPTLLNAIESVDLDEDGEISQSELLKSERIIRFKDAIGDEEFEILYSYRYNPSDSSNSGDMTICLKDFNGNHIPHCNIVKGGNAILDAYLSQYYLEICEIPSARKVNQMKIFIENLLDYRFYEPVIIIEYSSRYCTRSIHIQKSVYDNCMVNRLLNVFHDMKKEMETQKNLK